MRNPENVLNSLAKHSQISAYRFERLYRNLFNPEMFYVAYQKLYAKEGNMTAGADGQTIDRMSTERIERLIVLLKDEQYQPMPSGGCISRRRTEVNDRSESPHSMTSWYRRLSV